MNKFEKIFFGVGIGHPLVTATIAAALGMFNPTNTGFCWINMNPLFCNDVERGPIVEAYCEGRVRAENWFLWHMLFSMSWIYIALIVIAGSMISLYLVVRKQENRVSRSSLTAQDSERQRKILIRGMLYVSIYLLIWIPVSLNFLDSEDGEGGDGDDDEDDGDERLRRLLKRGARLLEGDDEDEDDDEEGDFDFFDIFEFLATIVLPAQGFLNALIYSGVLDRCIRRVCCCTCCKSKVPIAGAASTHYFASSKMSGASSRNLPVSKVSSDGGMSASFRRPAGDSGDGLNGSHRSTDMKEPQEGPKETKIFTRTGNKSVTFDNSTIETKSGTLESQPEDEH